MRNDTPNLLKLMAPFLGALLLLSADVSGQMTELDSEDEERKFLIQSSLRGKAAVFFIIEDIFIHTATIGAEFKYKRHNIGLDYTSFKWTFEQDNEVDVPMYDQFEKMKYLLVDYKFDLKPINNRNLYINVYFKNGSYNSWYDSYDVDLSLRDSLLVKNTSAGRFKEIGAGLGIKRNFGQSPMGIDLSANLAIRYSTTDIYTYYTYDQYIFQDNAWEELPVFYTRLNLYFRLD
ncbi:MAG: hypothetical protein ACOYLH_09965 [Flavobacteriales bacterium]